MMNVFICSAIHMDFIQIVFFNFMSDKKNCCEPLDGIHLLKSVRVCLAQYRMCVALEDSGEVFHGYCHLLALTLSYLMEMS